MTTKREENEYFCGDEWDTEYQISKQIGCTEGVIKYNAYGQFLIAFLVYVWDLHETHSAE